MKAYKIELLIIDHDKVGKEGIIHYLEDTKYPNYCISPQVKNIIEKDIGEWSDNHPLNLNETTNKEYERLFNNE